MNSLNITNLKNPEISTSYVQRCNSAIQNLKKDKISELFERHETIRKIVSYLPTIIIGGSILIEKTTSYRLLSNIGIVSGIVLTTMWFFASFAQSSERSLQTKKIESLN